MVTDGDAVTVVPVVWFKPVAGLHEYVSAPPAVKSTELPKQMEGLGGFTVTTGAGFTVTVTESVSLPHPPASVTITV